MPPVKSHGFAAAERLRVTHGSPTRYESPEKDSIAILVTRRPQDQHELLTVGRRFAIIASESFEEDTKLR